MICKMKNLQLNKMCTSKHIQCNSIQVKCFIEHFKVCPEGLMVDMASKNISRCTVSFTALPMKTDLHFQPTLS